MHGFQLVLITRGPSGLWQNSNISVMFRYPRMSPAWSMYESMLAQTQVLLGVLVSWFGLLAVWGL